MKGAPTDPRSRGSRCNAGERARGVQGSRERECIKGRGGGQAGGGTGSFNILTERPTDLPTYQPTGHVRRRLPRSCTESKTDRDGDKARAKHTSCSPKGD